MEAKATVAAMHCTATVLLAGKIGSGKTYILNKLCSTAFASKMLAESCTRTIQEGSTRHYSIRVIDTPGFYSSDDSAAHTEAQRMAMEQNALAGIYVVVRFGRSDEMAETLNKIMDFVGDEVRIIISHCDFLCDEKSGVDVESIMLRLSALVDVNLDYIIPVGKHTPGVEIENFIAATLHAPLTHELTEVQLASVHDQRVGARKFNKAIQEIKEKIQAASTVCHELSLSKFADERDSAIVATRHSTKCMVDEGKSRILREAQELTVEQQYLLNQEIRCSVSVPFEAFQGATIVQNGRNAPHSRLPELHAKFVPARTESSNWCVEFCVGKSVHPTKATNAKQVVEKIREANTALVNNTITGKRHRNGPSAAQPHHKKSKACNTIVEKVADWSNTLKCAQEGSNNNDDCRQSSKKLKSQQKGSYFHSFFRWRKACCCRSIEAIDDEDSDAST